MKKVSLEKEIAAILNSGKKEGNHTETNPWNGKVDVCTVSSGTFKCSFPEKDRAEIIAQAKRMMRKPALKFPVPITQKILAFLYNNKEAIPYYVEMVNKGKGQRWFENRIGLNFPNQAKEIIRQAVYGTESDRKYALSTMPKAWGKYTVQHVSEETKVVFRKFKNDGAIIALFPELPGNKSDHSVLSYMWMGEHSSADYQGVISLSTPAKEEEYLSMKVYLEGRGYNHLKVLSKAKVRL